MNCILAHDACFLYIPTDLVYFCRPTQHSNTQVLSSGASPNACEIGQSNTFSASTMKLAEPSDCLITIAYALFGASCN